MSQIMHYVTQSDMLQSVNLHGHKIQISEYVIITDCDDLTDEFKDANCVAGFQFNRAYELEFAGILPTERILVSLE